MHKIYFRSGVLKAAPDACETAIETLKSFIHSAIKVSSVEIPLTQLV